MTPPVTFDAAHCIAEADTCAGVIRVTAPGQLGATLVPDSPLAQIDPELLFDSVILHELSHIALVDQPGGADLTPAEHEYVAYSLQLDALGPEGRAPILERAGLTPPVGVDRINLMILSFDPMRFAAYAWHYFDAPGRGCASVDELLSGVALFPDMSEP